MGEIGWAQDSAERESKTAWVKGRERVGGWGCSRQINENEAFAGTCRLRSDTSASAFSPSASVPCTASEGENHATKEGSEPGSTKARLKVV